MLRLCNISTTKLRQTGLFNHQNDMLNLADYDKIAIILIRKHCQSRYATDMMNSPEALGYIVECLMFGSCRWNKNDHNDCSHLSYLYKCGRWAILRWFNMANIDRGRQQEMSLSHSYYNNSVLLIDVLTDHRYKESMKHEELRNDVLRLIESAPLTDRQQECITRVYINGQRQAHVARELGISREAVRQLLTKGIEKIKKHEHV